MTAYTSSFYIYHHKYVYSAPPVHLSLQRQSLGVHHYVTIRIAELKLPQQSGHGPRLAGLPSCSVSVQTQQPLTRILIRRPRQYIFYTPKSSGSCSRKRGFDHSYTVFNAITRYTFSDRGVVTTLHNNNGEGAPVPWPHSAYTASTTYTPGMNTASPVTRSGWHVERYWCTACSRGCFHCDYSVYTPNTQTPHPNKTRATCHAGSRHKKSRKNIEELEP